VLFDEGADVRTIHITQIARDFVHHLIHQLDREIE